MIHVLVEGPSERTLLEEWGERLLGAQRIRVHPHQGKGALPSNLGERPRPKRRGLLDQLPAKLRGFARSSQPGTHQVLVLIDADRDDPVELAGRISAAATNVAPDLSVAVCVAVEETEAFYLGDLAALRRAFPSADMSKARAYEPDSVVGTWELFGEIVRDPGGNKVAWAEAMSPVLTIEPARSRSPSFRCLVRTLSRFEPQRPAARKPRRHRHLSRKERKPSGRR